MIRMATPPVTRLPAGSHDVIRGRTRREQTALVPSGPAWLARPTTTNLDTLEGCAPRQGRR